MASVDLVLPVYNEERILVQSAEAVLGWTEAHPEHRWRVVVADNASTDGTLAIARELEAAHAGRLAVLHLPVKGRGIAVKTAWLTSPADVLAFMDIDLSTDIAHIPEIVDPIAAGEADLTFGTRLHPDSRTERGWRREFVSQVYIRLVRHVGGLRVTDAQCGFKAIGREPARALLPLVRDAGWFFDTELLLLAQENGYRLHEVPVRWVEDRDSRVFIVGAALGDLRGLWRLRVGGVPKTARDPGGADGGGAADAGAGPDS